MLKKFLIERNLPGVGKLSEAEFENITGTSNEVLSNLGTDIQWRESYVTDDKVYCVYFAKNEEIIREHARRGGFPANKISEIITTLDPTSDQRQQGLAPRNESYLHNNRGSSYL